jgi:transcriptional regulator with XRE-family HTH domain
MPKSHFTDAHKVMVKVLVGARARTGLHQSELAKRLGKGQSYISNIERGERRVDVIEFYALARAMGADPIALFAEVAAALPKRVEV